MKLITDQEIEDSYFEKPSNNPKEVFVRGIELAEEKMKGLMVEFANAYAVHFAIKKSILKTPMKADDFLQKFMEERK